MTRLLQEDWYRLHVTIVSDSDWTSMRFTNAPGFQLENQQTRSADNVKVNFGPLSLHKEVQFDRSQASIHAVVLVQLPPQGDLEFVVMRGDLPSTRVYVRGVLAFDEVHNARDVGEYKHAKKTGERGNPRVFKIPRELIRRLGTVAENRRAALALPKTIRALQERVRAEAAIVVAGEEPGKSFLGLVAIDPRSLDPRERDNRLDGLIRDIQELVEHLENHREELHDFFSDLGSEASSLVSEKILRIRELDAKRAHLEDSARKLGDRELSDRADDLEQRLISYARIVGDRAHELLDKFEESTRDHAALEHEHIRHRKTIEKLSSTWKLSREIFTLEKTIGGAERAVGAGEDRYLDKEIRESLTSFGEVLAEIAVLSERLCGAADDIARLTENFERLGIGDSACSISSPPATEPGDLEQTLKRIEASIVLRLEDSFGRALRDALKAGTPAAWRDYLARCPEARGADLARENLARMENEATTRAREAETLGAREAILAWRSLSVDFPESSAAEEARTAIARWRAETLGRARAAQAPAEALECWSAFEELFPDKTAKESREAVEALHTARVRIEPSPRNWRAYVAACPDGPLIAEAREYLDGHAWIPEWAAAWGVDSLPNGARWAELDVKGVRQRFRLIQPGVFLMGSADDESGREAHEGPRHEVTLTRGFWLAESECTQAFWEAVTGSNPSQFKGADLPVENVSWEDCVLFTNKLSSLAMGLEARLPNEAEWEYACRAGTTGSYAGTTLLQEMGWTLPDAGQTHPVKTKAANAWGLFDMHGNVCEWVGDALRNYGENVIDPGGPAPEQIARHRGGCWNWNWAPARAAYRGTGHRTMRGPEFGLRIAASVVGDGKEWVRSAAGQGTLDRLARPPKHGVFLGDLKAAVGRNSSYEPTPRDAWGSRSCLVGGRTCSDFVTVHAPCEATWRIPEGASAFSAICARRDQPKTFHGTWKHRVLLDGKLVFETVPFHEQRNGIPIEIKIPPGAKCLTIATDMLGDADHDQALLAWPFFHTHSPLELLARIPGGGVFAGDLEPKHCAVGHGSYLAYRDVRESIPDRGSVRVSGKACDAFLDMHAPAEVTWSIPENAFRFTAIGSRWDREGSAHGTWRYEILIDGRRVFDSPPLYENPDGIPIDVAIPFGARELTARIDDFGDKQCDWSALAWPCFHLRESAAETWKTLALQPNEIAIRTSAGEWLRPAALGDRIVTTDDPTDPEAHFRRVGDTAIFNLQARDGRFVKVENRKIGLVKSVDPQNHYMLLSHASAGRFAFRPMYNFDLYLSSYESVLGVGANALGADEAFEVFDAEFPPEVDVSTASQPALPKERVPLRARGVYVSQTPEAVFPRGAAGLANLVLRNIQIVPGQFGDAFAFNGAQSGIELTLDAPLSSDLTIAFRFQFESYVRGDTRIMLVHQSNKDIETLVFNLRWGRLRLGDSSSRSALTRGELLMKHWYHAALVVDGLGARIYLDGHRQVDGSFASARQFGSSFWIGRSAGGEPDRFFHGLIEDFRLFDRALTGAEIRSLTKNRG